MRQAVFSDDHDHNHDHDHDHDRVADLV